LLNKRDRHQSNGVCKIGHRVSAAVLVEALGSPVVSLKELIKVSN